MAIMFALALILAWIQPTNVQAKENESETDNYGNAYVSQTLTDEEKEWLAEHPIIRVGYLDQYLPYCATGSDGQATGLMTDVLKGIFTVVDTDTIPNMEYKVYGSYQELVEAVRLDEVDLAFPVSSMSLQLEKDNISASSDVITDRGAYFYRTLSGKEDIHTIAVNEGNLFQEEYRRISFPDAEIVTYPTIDDCLDAVLEGKVDGTIMDSLRIQYVTENSKYDRLSYVQLMDATGKSFGVARENKGLLMLVNRGLELLGSTYGYDHSYQYLGGFYSHTLMDYITDHIVGSVLVTGCLILIIILLFSLYIRKQKHVLAQMETLKREAEEANAAKSTFLFNMSHDIRTPMNAVLGFNELMLKDINDPEKLKTYIEKVRFSGEYLLSLINNVLEVARIDSGHESVNEEFADLMDESYYIVFENEVKKKNLDVVRNVHVTHRYVYTDVQKIREILLNIISNAIKYTPDGGTIRLALEEQDAGMTGYADYICTISDTGIGMTEEFQGHIFDTFTRERNSTESQIMGTGLGMAIVKKLTDLMGGTITVESKPGEGTTFTVSMRMRIVENPEDYLDKELQEEKEENLSLEGRQILVAEDNELNAEIITAVLENIGAAVDVASDGVRCIDLLQSHDAGYYDVILMDVQMPNLDGYSTTRKIRAFSDPLKASIPIIAMTANAFEEDRQAAMEAGMNGHVGKPVDVNVLMQTFRELL